MAVADATADLIRSLDDPKRFRRLECVSVFKPHVRDFPAMKLPNGTVIPARRVEVTEADLPTIAANVNRTYSQDGQLVLLTIGHRKQIPGTPETEQPPKVGYARNYRAQLVDRPGGKTLRLTHTEYIDRRHEYEAAKHPGRSPEYDPDEKTISAVALLTRDPALPNGTVHYDAGSGRVLYAMGDAMADEAWTPDDDAQYDKFCGDVKKYGKHSAYMRKYMAEAGPANTDVPGLAPAPQMPEYAAVSKALLYEKVNRRLDALGYEGVQFDRTVELTKLAEELKTDGDRDKHLAYMRAHYSKLPVGDFLPVFDGKVGPGAKPGSDAPLTEAECSAALHYQSEKGTDWPAAMQYVKAQRLAA
jgi:hypothetical protein